MTVRNAVETDLPANEPDRRRGLARRLVADAIRRGPELRLGTAEV
jgi:hypothetical protein